jgi:hypothetical protein
MLSCSESVASEYVDAFFETHDTNNDGSLSFKEFRAAFEFQPPTATRMYLSVIISSLCRGTYLPVCVV